MTSSGQSSICIAKTVYPTPLTACAVHHHIKDGFLNQVFVPSMYGSTIHKGRHTLKQCAQDTAFMSVGNSLMEPTENVSVHTILNSTYNFLSILLFHNTLSSIITSLLFRQGLVFRKAFHYWWLVITANGWRVCRIAFYCVMT